MRGKHVIIVGATGGLGEGIAKRYYELGANVLLVGRNTEKLNKLDFGSNVELDVTNPDAYTEFVDKVKLWSDSVDIIVNATGCDVRKKLSDHEEQDIDRLVDVNIKGMIRLTRSLLPVMKKSADSRILHIGGFADGGLAFPFYSVDVATRSATYAFVEAMNRELAVLKHPMKIQYFCPSPADTEAERPYHKLWRDMGTKIESVEDVAERIVNHTVSKKTNHIMGGFMTSFFTKLNSLSPKLADTLMIKKYGQMLYDYFYPSETLDNIAAGTSTELVKPKKSGHWLTKMAIVFVILSFVLYGLLGAVPFVPCTLTEKAGISAGLVASGEAVWWIGLLILGKEVMQKYRKYLNPCNWCKGAGTSA